MQCFKQKIKIFFTTFIRYQDFFSVCTKSERFFNHNTQSSKCETISFNRKKAINSKQKRKAFLTFPFVYLVETARVELASKNAIITPSTYLVHFGLNKCADEQMHILSWFLNQTQSNKTKLKMPYSQLLYSMLLGEKRCMNNAVAN